MVAIFVYSLARGEETEHYKIKQPIRQKSPLFLEWGNFGEQNNTNPSSSLLSGLLLDEDTRNVERS